MTRFVEDVRVVDYDGPRQVSRLPDGRTILHLRVFDGGRDADLTASGPRTHAVFKTVTGVVRTISVELKPGWSTQVLGVPAHQLTDRYVALEDLWGRAGMELTEQLVETRSVPEILDRIWHALAVRADTIVEPASARLARRAVRILETDPEGVQIGSVAKRLGITPRHLRRAFVESIGIGPKDFARTVRLHRAVNRATSSADWGQIATAAGYYDQAHLITDFRDLVGLTPSAYAKHIAVGARTAASAESA